MKLILIYLVLLLITVVILLFWLVIYKWQKQQIKNRWNSRQEHVTTILEAYMHNKATSLPRMFLNSDGDFRKWVFEQLAYYINKNHFENDRLLQMLKESGFYKEILDQLTGDKWVQRLEGLNSVSIFQILQAKKQVVNLLSDSHPLVRWKAFDTLGIIGDFEDFSILVDFIVEQKANYSPKIHRIVSVLYNLRGYHDDSIHIILSTYESTDNVFAKRCLLELLGKKRWIQSISFLQEQLSHNESEIRIGAIKSLIELGISDAVPYFFELIKWSENNEVKIVAMKGIAYLGGEKYKQSMIENLGHSLWWIRYYSALGITRLGEEGEKLLKSLSINYPDEYGRDMAKYFLQITEKERALWNLSDRNLKIG